MAGYTVGVDVGGTNILAAVVNELDEVVATHKVQTPLDSPDSVMTAIAAAIEGAVATAGLKLSSIEAIGLGVPGVVGSAGECIWAPNAPLSGVPVASIVRDRFECPVAVGNDVNVGTLGECYLGAGRGFQNVFGMFVGTGIGGGLVINSELVAGDHALGAEVGHIIIDAAAARRGDEGGGEFEYLASRTAIDRNLKAAIDAGRETTIATELATKGGDRIKSGMLRRALQAGDPVVTEVLTEAAELIGIGTVTVIHICDPEVIIFGGGVIEACGEFMMPLIEESIARHVAPGNGKPIRILTAELGDNAGVLGAVALARARAQRTATYPLVEATEFGSALADGDKYESDIVIRANGSIKKRRKKLSREVHGTAHEVSKAEVQHVCKGKPMRLIVGCGHYNQLSLAADAEEWLARKGIALIMEPTPEAAVTYNRTPGTKALLLHVAC